MSKQAQFWVPERYKNIPWDMVKDYANNDIRIADWSYFSTRQDLKWEFVETHLDWNWDWCRLSMRQDLTWNFIETHLEWYWDWSVLSNRVSWGLVEKHMDWPWRWYHLSLREDVPKKLVQDLAEKQCEQQLRALYAKHGNKQEE